MTGDSRVLFFLYVGEGVTIMVGGGGWGKIRKRFFFLLRGVGGGELYLFFLFFICAFQVCLAEILASSSINQLILISRLYILMFLFFQIVCWVFQSYSFRCLYFWEGLYLFILFLFHPTSDLIFLLPLCVRLFSGSLLVFFPPKSLGCACEETWLSSLGFSF